MGSSPAGRPTGPGWSRRRTTSSAARGRRSVPSSWRTEGPAGLDAIGLAGHPAHVRGRGVGGPAMPELYSWWVYLHIFGAFTFVFAHGASALAAFRIRATRDPVQIRTLLDVSSLALGVMYIGLLLLLVGGI